MLYALIAVVWFTAGDPQAIARSYKTEAACQAASKHFVDSARASGVVTTLRITCVPVSNPVTERAS